MSILKQIAYATVLLAALALPLFSSAQTPEEHGLQIAQEADQRDTGFIDEQADLKMILRNSHGEESIRELRNRTLERAGVGDKSLVIFDHPRDVKGTAFLTFSQNTGDDDQWLYLPALKRVKRISSSNKSGPFMGSEFAYEDISSQEVEEYTYRFDREESLNGDATFVVERVPKHPKSGYTRQLVWYDQKEYRVYQIEYYDRKGDLLKTLVQSDFEQHLGRFWRPKTMTMVNHQTGKSTELRWDGYQFENGFEETDFDRASLARAR